MDGTQEIMTPPNLTASQAEVMAYLYKFHAEEDRIPSTYELQKHFGFKSQTGAISHLKALEKHGLLEHRSSETSKRGWWRFTREETNL